MKYTIYWESRGFDGTELVRGRKVCLSRAEMLREKEYLVERAKARVRVYDEAGRNISTYNSFRPIYL